MYCNQIQEGNELYNVLDPNYNLYVERDHYATELVHTRLQLQNLETQTIAPLRDENTRLQSNMNSLQNNLTVLQKECVKWKNSCKEMAQKLSIEKEATEALMSGLQATTDENLKLKEEIAELRSESSTKLSTLEKERDDSIAALSSLKVRLAKVSQNFIELQKMLVDHEVVIKKMKSKHSQMKSTCRVYKTKCQKLTDEMTELRTRLQEGTISRKEAEKYEQLASISVSLVDYVKHAGKDAAQNCAEPPTVDLTELTDDDEHTAIDEDQMKRLSDQLTSSEAEIKKLKNENETVRKLIAEKEESFVGILEQAKNRVLILTELVDKYRTEAKQCKGQIQTIKVEAFTKEADLKTMYEARLSEEEEKKNNLLNELDQLKHRIEVLSSRVATQQKLLRVKDDFLNDWIYYVRRKMDSVATETQKPPLENGEQNPETRIPRSSEQSSFMSEKWASMLPTPTQTVSTATACQYDATTATSVLVKQNRYDPKQGSVSNQATTVTSVLVKQNQHYPEQGSVSNQTFLETPTKRVSWKEDATIHTVQVSKSVKTEAKRIGANKSKKKKSKCAKLANSPGKFSCPTCSKLFVNEKQKMNHIRNCSARSLRCYYCSMSFCSKKDLNLHVVVFHDLYNSFKCSHCNRSFSQISHLKRHEETC